MKIGPKSKSTLVYLQELTKGIYVSGTDNCVYCALRVDEYIARGKNLRLGAVSTEDAGLVFRTFIDEKIRSAFTRDQRIIARTRAPSKNYCVTIDVDKQPGTTGVLTIGSQPQNRVDFFPESKENLIQALQALPRRKKDGTAYGFILLMHKETKDLSHMLNYFVNCANQVFFIDVQESTLAKKITTELDLSDFPSYIFYRPSIPPEGIKIKKESDIIMKNEVDIFIDKMAEAAIAKNDEQLKSLLQNGPSVNVYGSDELNVVMRLLKAGQREAADFLLGYGAKLEDFACYAAFMRDRELGNFYVQEMKKQGLKPNFNRLAAYVAKGGGDIILIEHFLRKIPDESKRNYSRVATYAAKAGHKELAAHICKLAELSRKKAHMRAKVSQNQNSENSSPGAKTLIFSRRTPPPAALKISDTEFIKQELSRAREEIELLKSELAIKDKRIALQEKEIAALRQRSNENEQEPSKKRALSPW